MGHLARLRSGGSANRAINHSNRAKLSDRNGFALLFLSVLYVLYLSLPEQLTMSSYLHLAANSRK
jgi:hypothetical protein